MTKEEMAAKLTGRQYGREITEQEEAQAKGSELIVIYGYSDDGVELRGSINEELGAYNGTTFRIAEGKLIPEIEEDDKEILEKHGVLGLVRKRIASAPAITARWCPDVEGKPSWDFVTEIPHAVFDVMEDDDLFCRGIVIDLV